MTYTESFIETTGMVMPIRQHRGGSLGVINLSCFEHIYDLSRSTA
ncbi:MAG: hypothetical protein AAGF75_01255 [Cyanobacteria bacterium P01_H01_bin.130]